MSSGGNPGINPGLQIVSAYHGQATLRVALVRFPDHPIPEAIDFWRPHWFLPEVAPFQERLGGRLALVSKANIAANNSYLQPAIVESRGDDPVARFQLDEVVDDCQEIQLDTAHFAHGRFQIAMYPYGPAAAAIGRAEFLDAFANQHVPTTPGSFLEHGAELSIGFLRADRFVPARHIVIVRFQLPTIIRSPSS